MPYKPNPVLRAMVINSNESQYIGWLVNNNLFGTSDPLWWDALAEAWMHTNWTHPYRAELLARFKANREMARQHMMRSHERRVLAALPDIVTVYRGGDKHYLNSKAHVNWTKAISWTLDRRIAARFAAVNALNMRNKHPTIVTATVRKQDICAVLLGRGEREVITFAPRVTKVEYLTKEEAAAAQGKKLIKKKKSA